MTEQPGSVDLNGQNRYGEVFIPRKTLIEALEKIGLKIDRANWRVRSSEVRFEGKIEDIDVNLRAYLMVDIRTRGMSTVNLSMDQIVMLRPTGTYFAFMKCQSPHTNEVGTHFKLKGYLPENTTLRGKGRDRHAWKIYRKIAEAINTASGFLPSSNEAVLMSYEEAIDISRGKEVM